MTRWTFTLYDLNGDGFITRREVLDVVLAVHDLMGLHGSPMVRMNVYEEGWVFQYYRAWLKGGP